MRQGWRALNGLPKDPALDAQRPTESRSEAVRVNVQAMVSWQFVGPSQHIRRFARERMARLMAREW